MQDSAMQDSMALSKPETTGRVMASDLQRIGFASNEFVDTRRGQEQKGTKEIVAAINKVADILKSGEPLVLPASN